MPRSQFPRIQPLLAFAAAHPDSNLSLAALSARAKLSPFHLHRVFVKMLGETPKQFTERLRLDIAAVMLLSQRNSVLNVALCCGFNSHEVFCRAFRRRFGIAPGKYRARGFTGGASAREASNHAHVVRRTGPCIALFHTGLFHTSGGERIHMAYSIETKELTTQPALVIARRIARSELAQTLGELFGRIFQYAQQAGAALAGPPFTRYLEWGPGLIHIEAGMPIVAALPGQGEIAAATLPSGPAATTIHSGPYETLPEAHAAVEIWIRDRKLLPAGPPWESYVTDPADHPNPADWQTEIFWPLATK
ncbi:MAG TPA: AraC family transcriptional regulator [Bryobacteraceae bacterium]|nr:AraC family transcriptional regulator [Bryobacteraceae bacterium]